MTLPSARVRLPMWLRYVSALAALFIYFAQYLTVPPNSSEGAVMMDYVHRLAEGQRLHFDVFDYYGPIAWLPYSFFYELAGQQLIGVRVLLLLLKLAAVILTFALIRRLSDRFHASLGALTVAVLVGQPWPFFQIPYAPHLTFPMLLGVWLLILPLKTEARWPQIAGAALVTGLLLWTKVNTGAYVLAGVALYLGYWAPLRGSQRASAGKSEKAVRVAQWLGLIFVALAFNAFIREHLNTLYFVYLSLPLLVALAWTVWHLDEQAAAGKSTRPNWIAAFAYVTGSLLVWAVVLLAYFGVEGGKGYLAEQWTVLSRFNYESALLPPGAKGQYRGFNRYFWPQLPWLTTGIALYWLFSRRKRRKVSSAAAFELAEARLAGLFIAGTLHGFVIYARGDEVHLVQGVVAAAVVLFGMLGVLQGVPLETRPRRIPRRWIVGLVTLLAAATIFAPPRLVDFSITFGDWASPRLSYLRYHSDRDDRADELPVGMTYAEWD
ncbi:MAG TPA: hypothetical protein VK524_16295, partial [Polyangiaceae bacterium]|nr:hypothetical protein [Polyangiaceae bacterium]